MAERHHNGGAPRSDQTGRKSAAIRSAEPEYTPSPQEIAAAAAEIRAGWDQREHYRRAGQLVPFWTASNYGQLVDSDSAGWTPPTVNGRAFA